MAGLLVLDFYVRLWTWGPVNEFIGVGLGIFQLGPRSHDLQKKRELEDASTHVESCLRESHAVQICLGTGVRTPMDSIC